MTLLIGHRGAGKTQFLYWSHQSNYFKGSPYFDLDQVITEEAKQSIDSIFNHKGEDFFRALEIHTIHQLQQSYPHAVIAVGAGCQLEKLKLMATTRIIWIRRTTDLKPRYFTNRPTLSNYQDRILMREQLYARFCDEVLEIPEGFHLDSLNQIQSMNQSIPETCITLTPWYLRKTNRLQWLISQGLHQWVEIRTDFTSLLELDTYLQPLLPELKKKVLLSIRNSQAMNWIHWAITHHLDFKIDIEEQYLSEYELKDWQSSLKFISTHQDKLPNSLPLSYSMKWSPRLTDWTHLANALDWLKAKAAFSCYLMPRLEFSNINPSHQSWIRSYISQQQDFHFVRACPEGSASNQPHWVSFALVIAEKCKYWLAVLGQPIEHSISPTFHAMFAKKNNSYFLAIPITQDNFNLAISQLCQLDFKGFAVTSPLKILAAQQSFIKNSPLVSHLESANTLVKVQDQWLAYNTDLIGVGMQLYQLLNLNEPIDIPNFIHKTGDLNSLGLNEFCLELKHKLALVSTDFLIFGGGGMLPILKWWLPEATYIKARETQPINSTAQYFIWAANNEADLPLLTMKNLTTVIDLNYTQNSPAITLAQKIGVSYQSGELLFKTQAYCQQQLWQQAYLEDGT